MLTEKELRYVRARGAVLDHLRPVVSVLLAVVLGGYIYCWYRIPPLANPFYGIPIWRGAQVCPQSLRCLAAMAPVLFGTTAFLIVLLLAVMLTSIVIERRLLARLLRESESQENRESE
jgi:hypothetical protein